MESRSPATIKNRQTLFCVVFKGEESNRQKLSGVSRFKDLSVGTPARDSQTIRIHGLIVLPAEPGSSKSLGAIWAFIHKLGVYPLCPLRQRRPRCMCLPLQYASLNHIGDQQLASEPSDLLILDLPVNGSLLGPKIRRKPLFWKTNSLFCVWTVVSQP